MGNFVRGFAALLLLLGAAALRAEKVVDLPVPTRYVNDYAHVLSAEQAAQLEALSTEVHGKTAAELFVVTVNTLDDGASKEEFTAALVEKWKIGKAGVDRSALILFVRNPPGRRIETGYGLEGLLNDAKVGAVLDQANDAERAGNYGQAIVIEENALAQLIAADSHVTLSTAPVVHTYHRQTVQQPLGPGQYVLGGLFVVLLLYLLATGRLGWAWVLLNMFSGGGFGGGGGGGRDDDDRGGGGGFGGVGGGGSGGGGASRDF